MRTSVLTFVFRASLYSYQTSRLRTPGPPQASPFLRPRLRRPRDLPSRGGGGGSASVGEWRRFAESTSATRPHVVDDSGAVRMANSGDSPQQPSQQGTQMIKGDPATKAGASDATRNNNDTTCDDAAAWNWLGEDCLWPPGGHSGLLETNGTTEDGSGLLALAEDEMQRASKSAFSQSEASKKGGIAGGVDKDSFDVTHDSNHNHDATTRADTSLVPPSSPFSVTDQPKRSPNNTGSSSINTGGGMRSPEGKVDSKVQRIRDVAGLEAVSPLDLASVMALAAAAQVIFYRQPQFYRHP